MLTDHLDLSETTLIFFSQVIETKNAAVFISYSVIEDYFSYDGVYDDNEPDHSVRITMAIFFTMRMREDYWAENN